MNETVISCINLCKSYLSGSLKIDVLKDINLEINSGERVAIVGASGSGKSTLLHLLGTLDLPTQGQIYIKDQDVATLTEVELNYVRNRYLGFIYQFHHLLPDFTVLENVVMPLLISKDIDIKSCIREAEKILHRVGLDERSHHRPAELSGGERQRTAIARALVTKPKCILADEPTGNLDEKTAEQVFNLMLELNDSTGISFIMVTHNLGLANKMDKTYHLHQSSLQT